MRATATHLVGIDDTDNLDSRGTGFRARNLGAELSRLGLAQVAGITRHQLLVCDAIPYTSHNSSACLALRVSPPQFEGMADFCRDFLIRESAPGSDAGLCVAARECAGGLLDFGLAAQRTVLDLRFALARGAEAGVLLEGLTGTRLGVIGALAAVGLHAGGDDGRYIWARGVREASGRRMRARELLASTGIEALALIDGSPVEQPDAMVDLGPWPRPVRLGGRAVLLVEKRCNDDDEWHVASKEAIKAFQPAG
jgi:hypothetical protein